MATKYGNTPFTALERDALHFLYSSKNDELSEFKNAVQDKLNRFQKAYLTTTNSKSNILQGDIKMRLKNIKMKDLKDYESLKAFNEYIQTMSNEDPGTGVSSLTIEFEGSVTMLEDGVYIMYQEDSDGIGEGLKVSATMTSGVLASVAILDDGSDYVANEVITLNGGEYAEFFEELPTVKNVIV